MSVPQPPGRRPPGSGAGRRARADETLPGVQFPVIDDLGRIAADDEFLDAIAAGGADLRSMFAGAGRTTRATQLSAVDDPGGARQPVGLGPLLVAWRSELVEPPLPPLPTLPPRLMLAPADRSRRRSMRSLISVGAAICVLLMASTAVGARSAQPGQPLWGLTQVLWSDHANSIEAKVKVQDAIGVARKALRDGDLKQASLALSSVGAEVDKVDTDDGRADLEADLQGLRNDIQQRTDAGVASGGPSSSDGSTPGSTSGPAVPRGGLVPPAGASTSTYRPGRTSPPSIGLPPGAAPTTTGGGTVAQGPGTGTIGNPQSVTSFPVVPVLPATSTSSPVLPGDPGAAGPGTIADPATTAAAATTPPVPATTAPAAPTTADPTVTDAVSTASPTADPSPVPSTTAAPVTTEAPTTNASTTSAPSTDPPSSTADPSTPSSDPTTESSTADTPTSDAPTSASTTSEIPTTLDTTPSTDSNGSTTDDPSTTTTQTGPVNSSDSPGNSDGQTADATDSGNGDGAQGSGHDPAATQGSTADSSVGS